MKNSESITEEKLAGLAAKFSALGEVMRLRILRVLMRGECSVGDISAELSATQTNISKHLKKLGEAKIVSFRKEGVFVYYKICDANIGKICRIVCDSAD